MIIPPIGVEEIKKYTPRVTEDIEILIFPATLETMKNEVAGLSTFENL